MKDTVNVKLEWGSKEVEEDIIISGYDVTGQVTSVDGDPISGVTLNLYTSAG